MSLKKNTLSVPQAPTKLAALTAVVLLAHGGLLYGTPLVMAVHAPDSSASFSTRLLPLQPPAEPLQKAALQRADSPPQRPARREALAQSVKGIPLTTAPTTLRDDVDPGPSHSLAIDATAFSGVTPQPAIAQSLSGAPTLLAALDESKAAPTTAPPPLPSPTAAVAAPTAPARAAAAKTVQGYAFPPPMHLKYTIQGEIKGFPAYLKGDLQWKHDGKAYDARLEISHFLLGSRVQTSRGDLGAQGLEPLRFGDKRGPEVAAHFDRSKGKVTFSANTSDGALLPGTQDHLSVFMQLASMLGGAPASFPEGTAIAFEAVGPRSMESWVFKVGTLDKLVLPGGPVAAIKLTRDAVGSYGTRGEVWLAPSMGYLPVRIRLTESNGDLMDLRWSETVAP